MSLYLHTCVITKTLWSLLHLEAEKDKWECEQKLMLSHLLSLTKECKTLLVKCIIKYYGLFFQHYHYPHNGRTQRLTSNIFENKKQRTQMLDKIKQLFSKHCKVAFVNLT